MQARRGHQEAVTEALRTNQAPAFIMVLSEARLHDEWRYCVEHATLATYFLDRLVLSCWPRWCHRMRMAVWPNELDRRSAALLKSGALPAPSPEANAAPAATG